MRGRWREGRAMGEQIERRLAGLSSEQRQLLQRRLGRPPQLPAADIRPASLSLLFFAGGGAEGGADKYRLLLDCSRLADENGFEAVWVPERHFQPFGGLFPNPMLTAAAVAA